MSRAKLHKGYTQTIGETLQIATQPVDSAIPADAKTTITPTSMTGSIVRLDWLKGRFDGVYIESQRGDETVWVQIGFDMRSPYEDTRPPLVAGKPEERRYRMRDFIDNTAVGAWSDVVVVITIP